MKNWWLFILLFPFFAANGQKHISSADFYEKMNTHQDYIILDVRLYEEFLEDRIPGAFYAGEKKVLMKLVKDKSKETLMLVYCEYGERSNTVLKILDSKGFQNVYHLENGYLEWKEQGFPVDDTNINESTPKSPISPTSSLSRFFESSLSGDNSGSKNPFASNLTKFLLFGVHSTIKNSCSFSFEFFRSFSL